MSYRPSTPVVRFVSFEGDGCPSSSRSGGATPQDSALVQPAFDRAGSTDTPISRPAVSMIRRYCSIGASPASARPMPALWSASKRSSPNRKDPSSLRAHPHSSVRFRGGQSIRRRRLRLDVSPGARRRSSRGPGPRAQPGLAIDVTLVMASICRTRLSARRRAIWKSDVLRLRTSSPEKPKGSRGAGIPTEKTRCSGGGGVQLRCSLSCMRTNRTVLHPGAS